MSHDHVAAHFRRPFLIRIITARPRLLISVIAGLLVGLLIPDSLAHRSVTRFILGWNFGACLYLALVLRMMLWSSKEKMRLRARLEDEGQALILIFVILAAVTTLTSIVAELAAVKDMHDKIRFAYVGLAGLSIITTWLFTHTMFSLHYAHDYYSAVIQHKPGGLIFPGDELPDYADFLYFSFIIGTSGQTADVSFSSKDMRRTGLVHCVTAFFFNTTLLALTINIASGLF